jgi:hypothetical protein
VPRDLHSAAAPRTKRTFPPRKPRRSRSDSRSSPRHCPPAPLQNEPIQPVPSGPTNTPIKFVKEAPHVHMRPAIHLGRRGDTCRPAFASIRAHAGSSTALFVRANSGTDTLTRPPAVGTVTFSRGRDHSATSAPPSSSIPAPNRSAPRRRRQSDTARLSVHQPIRLTCPSLARAVHICAVATRIPGHSSTPAGPGQWNTHQRHRHIP